MSPVAERCYTRGVRRWLLVLIGLLYLISVPWYRDPAAPLQIVLGLPDWVTIAIACYLGVALLNSLAWSLTDVPDRPGSAGTAESVGATGRDTGADDEAGRP